MGLLSLTLPTIGQPNATEDSKVRDALTAIQTEFNGNIETTNFATSVTQLLLPTGAILPYGGSSAPSGFLLCDGTAITRGSFAALFAVIGESYGVGDGSTTFNVPDLRGRVPVGLGSNSVVSALGNDDGITEANRSPKHWHDADNLAANLLDGNGSGGINSVNISPIFSSQTWVAGYADVIGDVGVTTGPQDAPSFLVVNHIIKT